MGGFNFTGLSYGLMNRLVPYTTWNYLWMPLKGSDRVVLGTCRGNIHLRNESNEDGFAVKKKYLEKQANCPSFSTTTKRVHITFSSSSVQVVKTSKKLSRRAFPLSVSGDIPYCCITKGSISGFAFE